MERSDSLKELTAALAKAQIAFLPIKRTEKVGYDTTKGRKQYNYAPLNEVIEATKKGLSDNGLSIMQPTEIMGAQLFVITLLSHSSGEWVKSEMYVGEITQTPQAEGSALTYKRRYSLSAMLNIASEEDDDARESESATNHPKSANVNHNVPIIKNPALTAIHVPTTPPEGKQEAVETIPVDKTAHFCEKHQVNWFKKGNMRNFAHPIGIDGKWCSEPAAQKEIF